MNQRTIKIVENILKIYPHGENEPFVVKVMKSGWNGRYHVITEWGDTGESTHKLMRAVEILDFYNLDGNDLPLDNVYVVSKDEILNTPNDYDLGALVRKKIY